MVVGDSARSALLRVAGDRERLPFHHLRVLRVGAASNARRLLWLRGLARLASGYEHARDVADLVLELVSFDRSPFLRQKLPRVGELFEVAGLSDTHPLSSLGPATYAWWGDR